VLVTTVLVEWFSGCFRWNVRMSDKCLGVLQQVWSGDVSVVDCSNRRYGDVAVLKGSRQFRLGGEFGRYRSLNSLSFFGWAGVSGEGCWGGLQWWRQESGWYCHLYEWQLGDYVYKLGSIKCDEMCVWLTEWVYCYDFRLLWVVCDFVSARKCIGKKM